MSHCYMITTNHHVRETIDGWNVPADVRAEFDYVDWEAIDKGEDSRDFVKYRGQWVDLSDVMVAPDSLKALGWDGFNADSYWSGLAFRYFDRDGYELDGVVIASVYVS